MRTLAASLAILLSSSTVMADEATDKAVQKTLKALVGAIRYGKDDSAAKNVGFDKMAAELLVDEWAKMSAADKADFRKNLETLIRTLSFPKGKDMFQYLDAMLYDPARVEGDTAKVKSTVVVHRDLKKTEIVIDWVLVKEAGAWKVYDTVMLGESTIVGLRDEQVRPILKEGGVPAVLKAMRDKVAEVKKK